MQHMMRGYYPFVWITYRATFCAGPSLGSRSKGDLPWPYVYQNVRSFIIFWPGGTTGKQRSFMDLVWLRFSYTNPSYKRQRSIWKGYFEGMRRHLLLQDWDLMVIDDIETKWMLFKAVLQDPVENFCPLARLKRPLAKPWISRRIIAMQKQKKKLYKKSCLHILKSTGPATNTTTGFTPGLCGVSGQFTNRTSSRLPSVTQKSCSSL